MTRQELESFLSTHSVFQIAEFIIQKQVERYSAGFDTGYNLGYEDGLKDAAGHTSINAAD